MPSLTTTEPLRDELASQRYARMSAESFTVSDELRDAWQALQAAYVDMPADAFLPDGGRYRFRRYDRFAFDPTRGALQILPHEDYFQASGINAVTGGIVRKFAPLTAAMAANPFLHALIRFDFEQFPLTDSQRRERWQVDVHAIRVVARHGEVGQPTPEGIHRDGAEFVTVHLAELDNALGGTVSVYDDDRTPLAQFTLNSVLDAYMFEDATLWHEAAPIRPAADGPAVRSILTFDYHHRPDLQWPHTHEQE